MDAFHSTKRNFQTICTEIPLKSQEFPEIVEFPKNSGNYRRKFKWNGNSQYESFKNFNYLARLPSFPKFPENAVPFVTENLNFWKFKPYFFYRLESASRSSPSCDAKFARGDSPSSLTSVFIFYVQICES